MYDFLLGMPWHVARSPNFGYQHRIVMLKYVSVQVIYPDPENRIDGSNLKVRKFRGMLMDLSFLSWKAPP